MSTRRKKSKAIQFLEGLNGGPLTVGQALNSHRLCEELTLTAMGETLGISRQTLNDIERGRRRVSPRKAAEFGHALGEVPEIWARMALEEQLRAAGIEASVEVHKVA